MDKITIGIVILAVVMIIPAILLIQERPGKRDRFMYIYQQETEDPTHTVRMRKSRRSRRRGREPIARKGGNIEKRSRR